MDFLNEEFSIDNATKYYVKLNEENRIVKTTLMQEEDSQFLFEFPEGFDFSQIIHYKIINNELIREDFVFPEIEVSPSLEEQNRADIDYILMMSDL